LRIIMRMSTRYGGFAVICLLLVLTDCGGGRSEGGIDAAQDATSLPDGSADHGGASGAADATGAVALYQDGEELLEVTNLITDDSTWGQWYVGNLATGLRPADSKLYVDDVTIRSTR